MVTMLSNILVVLFLSIFVYYLVKLFGSQILTLRPTWSPKRAAVFTILKFKHQFKNLNYYSMPDSILIILRKRLLFICLLIILVGLFVFTVLAMN